MYVNTWTLYIGGGCINYLNQQIYFTPQHHTRAGRQKKVILRATIIRATAKILKFFLLFYVKFHKNQPGTGLHVWPSYVIWHSRENCLQIFVIVMIQLEFLAVLILHYKTYTKTLPPHFLFILFVSLSSKHTNKIRTLPPSHHISYLFNFRVHSIAPFRHLKSVSEIKEYRGQLKARICNIFYNRYRFYYV